MPLALLEPRDAHEHVPTDVRREALRDLGRIFEGLDDHEAAAEQDRAQQQPARPAVAPADGRDGLCYEQAAGQQQQRVEQAEAPVEQRLRTFE